MKSDVSVFSRLVLGMREAYTPGDNARAWVLSNLTVVSNK